MRTVHTSERTNFIFRHLLIPLSLQIGTRSTIIFLAIPIRHLVFLIQLIPADFQQSELFEMFDHLHFFIIHYDSCIGLYPAVRSLVCFTFNFSSLEFTILYRLIFQPPLLTAQRSVSSACLRLEPNSHLSLLQFLHFPPVVPLTRCINLRDVKKCNLASLLSQP